VKESTSVRMWSRRRYERSLLGCRLSLPSCRDWRLVCIRTSSWLAVTSLCVHFLLACQRWRLPSGLPPSRVLVCLVNTRKRRLGGLSLMASLSCRSPVLSSSSLSPSSRARKLLLALHHVAGESLSTALVAVIRGLFPRGAEATLVVLPPLAESRVGHANPHKLRGLTPNEARAYRLSLCFRWRAP
jgi:hypothetical protein